MTTPKLDRYTLLHAAEICSEQYDNFDSEANAGVSRCEYSLRALAATLPKEPAVPERLRALLEGLECEEIDNLMQQKPEILRAVGVEIAKAARLGADLYRARELLAAAPASGKAK
jgi:hypothetical protein